MSIINEALKKTEESIQKSSIKKTTAPDKKPKSKPYLFYILIFAACLFLGILVFTIIKRNIEATGPSEGLKTTPIEKEPQAAQILPAAHPSALTEEQAKPEKKFTLNGIFFSDNGGYALVNNQIARENDLVDGAKVEKITANTVELNNEGKIITLSTNR